MSLIITLTGCGKSSNIPDVSSIDGSFRLIRTETFLLDSSASGTDELLRSLRSDPAFWQLYVTKIMPVQVNSSGDSIMLSIEAIRHIAAEQGMAQVIDSIGARYSDMEDIRRSLESAFQFYKHYFPERPVPHVYTLFSDFAFFPFIFATTDGQDALGISLEMFLGADFPYQNFAGNVPAFSDYLVRTYNREHLVRKTMEVLVADITGPPPGERMLDQMIHNGKRLFILDKLMPYTPDTVIAEFSEEQLEWCEANERNLWAHYLQEDLIYSNEFRKVNKYLNYSPSIPGLPPQAPGRVANWSGWQIIEALVQREPDLGIQDILGMSDAQQLLDRARYRPQ